ncbi:MAG: hypothetical protein HY736_17400 [Verrucomicrobia bacterium]|nr:hypothetical protein [Verrucomicrobiota bacterium]
MFADDLGTHAHWLVSDVPGESTTLSFGTEGLTFHFAHTGAPTGINRHQAISKGSYPLLPGKKLTFRVNYNWATGSGNNCHSGFTVFAHQEQDETNAYFGNLNPENGDEYKIKAKEQNRQTFPEDAVKLRFGLPTGVAKGKDVIIRLDGDSRRIEWLFVDGGCEVSLGAWASAFPDRVRVRLHGRDWGIFPTPDRVTFARFQVYYENK